MNAPVPASQATKNVPALVAGGNVAALIPHSLEEAFRVATAIAQSGLAPRGLDRQEQILVAIMAGAELGLAPFQSLQSFAVVNGRPTLWGDGLMAVARAGGVRVKEWLEGEGEAAVAHCEVTRPEGEIIARSFSVTQAKKAGLWGKQGPWQAYPTRMLAMRARAYALRDGCADMLRGFQVREEVEDYEVARDVTPRGGTGMRARLEARAAEAEANGGFDAAHVEAELAGASEADAEVDAEFEDRAPATEEAADDFPGDRPSNRDPEQVATVTQTQGATLAQRSEAYEARIAAAPSTVKLKSIQAAAAQLRKDLDAGDPERLVELDTLFNDTFAKLEEAEKAGQ